MRRPDIPTNLQNIPQILSAFVSEEGISVVGHAKYQANAVANKKSRKGGDMTKPWDSACKRLLQNNPQDFIEWLTQQPCTIIKELPHELNNVLMEVDGLMLVEIAGAPAIYHFEFQTYYDGRMSERLLRYNIEIRWIYELPVYSFVIHLLGDGKIATSPLSLTMPDGQEVVTFHYQSTEISQLAPEDIVRTGKTSLLAFLPLTKGGAKRKVVEQMSQTLHRTGNVDLELVGLAFASLGFREMPEDLDWLLRSFSHMHDILADSPLFQEIIKWGREEGLRIGQEEARLEGRLESGRNILLSLTSTRFPELQTLAKRRAAKIEQPEMLEALITQIAVAQSAKEAEQYLRARPKSTTQPKQKRTSTPQ
jgi:predicted transposase YdaD